MSTRYYLIASNSYTTCDVSPSYDISLIDSAGLLTGGTSSTSYVEVMTFDLDAAGIASTGTYDISVPIGGLGGTSNNRWRLQQIDPGTCAVLNSSSYSSVYSTTGTKTDSLSLTWTGSTGILRLSIEQQKTGGAGPRTIDITIDTTSYIDVPAYVPPPDPPAPSVGVSIVRDMWWSNASGTSYLLNQAGQLSSYGVGLYRSLNADDAQFINIRSDAVVGPSGVAVDASYTFRVSHDNIVPNAMTVPIRYSAGSSGSPVMFGLSINGVSFGQIATTSSTSIATTSGTINLTDTQRKAILDNRQDEPYDYFVLSASSLLPAALNGTKIYNCEIKYNTDNTTNYRVSQSGITGAVVNTFYPVGIGAFNTTWKNNSGSALSSGDISLISESGFAAGADTGYIQCWNEPPQTTPQSGHLTLNFDVGNTYNYNANINKANLHLRLSLPNSGNGNQRDVFKIIGHSPNIGSGNIIWGSGGIVETSGFRLFDTELTWTNPWIRDVTSLSGNRSSSQFRSAESLRNLSIRVIGLPSGTQLSAASLRVESQPSNSLSLRTIGGSIQKRTLTLPLSGYSNTGGTAYNRYRGYSFIQNSGTREIFNKGYYQFQELTGPACISDVNNASGIYTISSTMYSGLPVRTHYYKDRAFTNHDDWRNAIYIYNPSSSRNAHIDFGNRVHASGAHSFMAHISANTSNIAAENTYGNILLYRGNGTDHEYIVSVKDDEVRYTLFGIGGSVESTLITNIGTSDNIFVVGSYSPSSGSANGFASLNAFGFDGTFVNDEALNLNISQYNDSYTSIGGSRNLAASISEMNANYSGWIHEAGFADRFFSLSDILSLLTSRYNGFNFYNQSSAPTAANNNYLEFTFNPASGNFQESLTIPVYQQNSPMNTNFPGFVELDYPTYADYDHISVAPSAVNFEMVVSHNTNHPSGVYLTGVNTVIDNSQVRAVFGSQILLPSSTFSTIKTQLFTKQTLPISSGQFDSSSTKLLLDFKYNVPSFYSELKIHSLKINMDSWMTSAPATGYLSLATSGAAYNGTLNLYLYNQGANNYVNLYAAGKLSSSGTLGLYTQGEPYARNTMNLLTSGQAVYLSGTLNLTTSGSYRGYSDFNLSTFGRTPPQASGTLNLGLWSTTNSGVNSNVTLYTNSELYSPYVLNLTTRGLGGSYNDVLYLTLNTPGSGIITEEEEETDPRDVRTKTKTLNMYVAGAGTPYSGSMNLFINRGFDGTTGSLPLYLKTHESFPYSGSVNLITRAKYTLPVTFYAIGDSYVAASSTSSNYGSLGLLRINS